MEIEFKSMLGAFFVIFVRVKDIEVKNKIFLDRIMKIVKKVRYIFIFYFLFINDVVYLVNYKFWNNLLYKSKLYVFSFV